MQTTTARSARWLRSSLLAAGFRAGAPAHVSPDTLAADKRIVRGMKCPGCGRRTMQAEPFHLGKTYRLIAVCQDHDCRCGEEA